MKDKSSKQLKKLAALTLISAAAGAVAGVLMAPQSGKGTRKILGKKARGLIREGEVVAQAVSEEIRSQAPKLRRHVKRIGHRARKLAKV